MNTKRIFSIVLSMLLIASMGAAAFAESGSFSGTVSLTGIDTPTTENNPNASQELENLVNQNQNPTPEQIIPDIPDPSAANNNPTIVQPVVDGNNSQTTVPTDTTPVSVPTDPFAPAAGQTPIPTMDPAIIASEYKITKHPYSENIEVGTSTSFSAGRCRMKRATPSIPPSGQLTASLLPPLTPQTQKSSSPKPPLISTAGASMQPLPASTASSCARMRQSWAFTIPKQQLLLNP